MKATRLAIPDVILLEPKVFGDVRGFFLESYNQKTFQDVTGLAPAFVQDNHSRSIHGVLRGLHYQIKQPQGKLARVTVGEVFDVAVDLRSESKTFGKWASIQLSAANSLQAYLPKGVAHGFQTTMPNSILHYCLSSPYSSVSSIAIDAFGDLGIQWPIKEISISERDSRGVTFAYAANQYAESLIKI